MWTKVISSTRLTSSRRVAVGLYHRTASAPSRSFRCFPTAVDIGTTHRRRRLQSRLLSTTNNDDDTTTGWIRPNRPLIGDQQPYVHPPPATSDHVDEEEELRLLQQEIDRLEQQGDDADEDAQQGSSTNNLSSSTADPAMDEEEELRLLQEEIDRIDAEEADEKRPNKDVVKPPPPPQIVNEDTSIDWLKTRRRVMGEGGEGENYLSASIPSADRHQDLFDVPVVHHTLLKKEEIATILTAVGGEDIQVIYDDPRDRKMGGPMGMILVTTGRPSQIRILADTLVRQMRRRNLQEVDVFGAVQGPEGTEDSNWMVVDCRNFIVHILSEQMRKSLNLEAIWSGTDPLRTINSNNEDEVDNYVAAHPVPDGYSAPVFDWDEKLRELQKNRWTAPHKRVVKKPKTKKRRS